MTNLNMAIFSGAALVGAVLLASSSDAQTKSTATARLRLVRAQCTTGPCNPDYSMISGSVQLKKVKHSKLASNDKIGNVNLKGVVALPAGTAARPTQFVADVSGTRYYSNNPASGCALKGSTLTGAFASATLDCFDAQGSSRCNGDIKMTPPEDSNCDDIDLTVEDIQVTVTPVTGAGVNTSLFARVGRTVVGDGNPAPVTGNSEGGRLPLTRAMCGGTPCTTYNFKAGLAVLKRVKYSRLLDPQTKVGRLKIKGLGPLPLPPTGLVAKVYANSRYGDEFTTDDCAPAPGTASGVVATAPMSCLPNGKCKGDLRLVAAVASGCTDVDWVMEDVRVLVYDAALVDTPMGLIAVDGAAVLAD